VKKLSYFAEINYYKFFLFQLIYRNFTIIYKQTVLGPFWQIFNPLAQSAIFTLVFSEFAKISTNNLPPFLFYSSAMLGWVLFQSSLLKTSNSLINSSYILKFAYFPKLLIPISTFIESLIFFLIHFIIFIIIISMYSFNGYNLNINWIGLFFLPFVIIYIALLAVFLGMIICCWSSRYRDLLQIASYGSQFLFYGTPVIYSITSVPEKYKLLFYFNPLTYFIEYFRFVFFDTQLPGINFLFIGIIIFVITGVFSVYIFIKCTKNIVDHV
jgi:lipopolysaccharide transport system permease protein